MPENYPNLEKETDIQVQEEQGVPNKMNLETYNTARHTVIQKAES